MTSPFPVLSVLRGTVTPFRGPGEKSAIAKRPIDGLVRVHRLGLDGDAQADLTVHGGPDKAIHHYPHDHYAWWCTAIGDHPLLDDYGAFGENISTRGLAEDMVCIGDRWRLGSALLEVSQGRQPCWKLDHRFGGEHRVNALCVRSRRAGWYYRVLEEGAVQAGDVLELVDRPFPSWTVLRVFGLLIGGDHAAHRGSLEALGEVTALAEAWTRRRARLLAG
ncbi:MOSC domain-containing protein [Novosphingobium sp. Leaf2]|uniref:MOSC domain-containing protein n=1 Tax=Novosphingobium sp. Leaf2 TaxID=1735670 RepID=UPI0006F33655|nr:MOSC domain-containing protein [Novosphingobium sp. Leaf2]KQM22137.1 molybdenum cofactor biosysynthesis protein [Novosphingobium sp. Leaf2]